MISPGADDSACAHRALCIEAGRAVLVAHVILSDRSRRAGLIRGRLNGHSGLSVLVAKVEIIAEIGSDADGFAPDGHDLSARRKFPGVSLINELLCA